MSCQDFDDDGDLVSCDCGNDVCLHGPILLPTVPHDYSCGNYKPSQNVAHQYYENQGSANTLGPFVAQNYVAQILGGTYITCADFYNDLLVIFWLIL